MGARCRLCAESYEELVETLAEAELLDRIFQFFGVKIVLNDKLPTTICRKCYETTNATWEFNERVQKAQEILSIDDLEKSKTCIETFEDKIGIVECVLSNTVTEEKSEIKVKVYTYTLSSSFFFFLLRTCNLGLS